MASKHEKRLEIQKQIIKAEKEGSDLAKVMAITLKEQLSTQKDLNQATKNRSQLLSDMMDAEKMSETHSERALALQNKAKEVVDKLKGARDKQGRFQKGFNLSVIEQLKNDKKILETRAKQEAVMKDVTDVTKEQADIMMKGIHGVVNKLNNIPVVGKLITKSFGLTEKNLTQVGENLGDIIQGNMKWKNLTKGTNKLSMGTLKVLGGVAVAVGGIFLIWKLFTNILGKWSAIVDKAGETFGVMGAQDLAQPIVDANQATIALGKDIGDIVTITESLSSEFGIGVQQSVDMAANILDSATAMGLLADEGAKLFGTLMAIGGLTQQQAEKLAESTYQLARANGVAPQAVMKDVAGSTEVFAKFAKDGGRNVLEAAVQARKLGLSVDDVAGIAEGLLDFQNSLNSEIEASIMLGRNVNLQRARELALTGDMSGMMDNILQQVGGEQEFLAMNVLERKALAGAVGLTADKMAKLVGEHGKLNKQQSFEDLLGEDALSTMTKITNKFKSMAAIIIQKAAPAIEQIALKLESWIDAGGAETLANFFTSIASVIAWMVRNMGIIMAALGATSGFMIGGPWGAAIGAIAGGAFGASLSADTTPLPQRFDTLEDTQAVKVMGNNVPMRADAGELLVTSGFMDGVINAIKEEGRLNREQQNNQWGVGGSVAKQIGSRVGTTISSNIK